jgi:parallel beta-helix repeat protein
MRKNRTFTLSLLIVIALFLFAFPSKGETQFSVNCDEGGSLQTTINNAFDWATILVYGTCKQMASFYTGRRGLTLDGLGQATIIAPDATAPAVLVRGDSITIRGFTISGGYDGVAVLKSGYAIIEGNTIESAGRAGINLENSATARIVNNTIRNNPGDGIKISENSSARIGIKLPLDTVEQPNTIEHNGGNGITVLRSSSAIIVGNTISENGGDGIKVAGVSQADISDNTIDGNDGNGILVTQTSGVNLGNDTGDTIYDLPNTTTLKNGLFGLKGTMGGYADGRLGTLHGLKGRVFFDLRSINSTKPCSW